ncbi:MAG: cbb3-type cytochrome oxidase assembly protein CcoS [Helicobacter sp.]|nr:cbb3-type cytochrome oxidase assembly protein CcoS [Helicobacter sp.]
MNSEILIMMLIASIFISCCGLVAFFWALKNNQFDDGVKMSQIALFDSEDELKHQNTIDKKHKK